MTIGIHAGSTYHHAPTASGWPSFQVEDYVAQSTAFEHQVVSLVTEGVFQKFPALKVVLLESGFTWLPTLLWRTNKEWRGTRTEVPWIDRLPAEIVRDHIRLTLQPVDAPVDAQKLVRTLEHIGSDRMLLFSTDYPHWHFDGDDVLPDGLSAELIHKILIENPLETYPRLRSEKSVGATAEWRSQSIAPWIGSFIDTLFCPETQHYLKMTHMSSYKRL